MKSLNEARILRTIPTKIWATVSSVISKKYRQDKGVTARPVGDAPTLLQKYVVGLILFKAQCPRTPEELINSEVFPLWAKQVVTYGYGVNDVIKLYNENTGLNIPLNADEDMPVQTAVSTPDPEPVIEEPEPVPAVQKRKYYPAPEPVVEKPGYKFKAELRTDVPGRPGEYKVRALDAGTIPYGVDIDEEWRSMVNKYNTPKYKTKCRSGIINVNLYIEIIDPVTGDGYAGIVRREGIFREVTPN